MTSESRVEQRLDALLESDGTPESVCGSCPELLPRVRTSGPGFGGRPRRSWR